MQYNFYNIEVYSKGDMAGYAIGEIEFEYNNTTYNHEFTFRYKEDPKNGEGVNILISIDYGYKIPYINDVWKDIESYLTEYCKEKSLSRS